MSNQAAVHSIEALRELRSALAVYADDVLSSLGGVEMELHRSLHWLQYDRPNYWKDQLKRRQERVASARAEVFRRKLAKTTDSSPAMSEQKEILRRVEASLQDAETRIAMVRKWGPALQQAILEYHASTRRIKDLASGDVPRAMAALGKMIDALEAYLRISPPSGTAAPPESSGSLPRTRTPLEAVAEAILAEESDPELLPPAPAVEGVVPPPAILGELGPPS